MKIYVIARSAEAAEEFQRTNASCRFTLVFLMNQNSFPDAINHVIDQGERALLVHDDVLLPPSFCDNVDLLCKTLDDTYCCWGLAGNAGISCYNYHTAIRIVRFIQDPHGGYNAPKGIYPAQSIDGNAMLINAPVLKAKGVRCPKIARWHFYDFAVSVECIKHQCGVFISHLLLLLHSSPGNIEQFNKASHSKEVQEYLAHNLKGGRALTICGEVPFTPAEDTHSIDLQQSAIYAASRKKPPQIAIVVRTQYQSPETILERCLDSIRSFIASSGPEDIFKAFVVSDQLMPDRLNKLFSGIEVLHAHCQQQDTRFELIRFALLNINADYMLFIDDDGFMFPQQAKQVQNTISCFENGKCFYFNSQCIKESFVSDAVLPETTVTHKTRAEDYLRSRFGKNPIPLCGIMLPVALSREFFTDVPFDRVVFGEDYALQLRLQMHKDFAPIALNTMVAGTCLRSEERQTVTRKDRHLWEKNRMEIALMTLNESNFFVSYQDPLASVSHTHFFRDHFPLLSRTAHKIRDTFRRVRHRL